MTQILRIYTDKISENPSHPRHLRSIIKKIAFTLLLGCGLVSGLFAQADSVKHLKAINENKPRRYKSDSIYLIDDQPGPSQDLSMIRISYMFDNEYLNQEYSSYLDMGINNYRGYDGRSNFTGFRPFVNVDTGGVENTLGRLDSIENIKQPKKSWLYRKVYQENLFIIHDTASKFYATIDPLFNFQESMDHSDSNKKYYQNTRGILIQGNVGNKFAFSSTFWENQADFPTYLNKFVQENYVVPGNGRTKSFGTTGYDFSMSEAYLSFSPSQHFNFQAGYGKNFIGDGYRSLLLSDNSFAYPYARITTTFWHLQYTNLYTEFMDPFADPAITVGNVEGLIQQKAGAFQYLSWNIVPQVEFGLFQGMIWTAGDQYNHTSFNANYFDPVIGVNALTYGLGATNNVLLGSTLKYKITKNIMAYGQLAVDEFPQDGNMQSIYNQTGYQAGIKYYNRFGEFQLEYNQVRPYTYSSSDSLENYSHYDQALGDPLGANFKELIGIINLRYHHFLLHLQGNYALEGLDSTGADYGNNIFLPLPNNTNNVAMLQGIRSTLMFMDAHISYLMNTRTNMNFTVGVSRRTLTNSLNNQPSMTLFYVGFRTSIENMYVDF